MKLFATLGSAFVLASAFGAQAATVFTDDFEDASFDSGGLLQWGAQIVPRDTCGAAILTCVYLSDDGRANGNGVPGLASNVVSVFDTVTYHFSVAFADAMADTLASVNFFGASDGMILSLNYIFTGLEGGHVFSGDFTSNFDQDLTISINTSSIVGEQASWALLDYVKLDQPSIVNDVPDVPLPASAPLLLAGLGVVGALRLRKAKA